VLELATATPKYFGARKYRLIEMSPIAHEYLKLTKNFRNKYGRNTIVFIQDGHTYKVFANNLNDLQMTICRNILQITIHKQDHALFLAEFNYNMYKYYEKNVLLNGYVVVYVDEVPKTFHCEKMTWKVRDIRNISEEFYEPNNCNFCTFLYASCCPNMFATNFRTFT